MSQFSPNIFSTFPFTVQHIKHLEGGFLFLQDMAHFDFWQGQKWRILTFSIKPKSFIYYKQMIIVLWKKSKFFIFDHVKIRVKMGHILPKWKNAPPNFLYVVQYMANYQKIDKLKKYWGQIYSFLPWTQNLKWTLRPSFCTQVKNSCVL